MKIKDIVGQEKLKRAVKIFLISNIDSMLISGPKGSGKSVFVDSIEKTLGKKVNKIPIGASEDMIFGSFSIDDFLTKQKKTFQKGILERSENEILFLDNINLFSESNLKEILDSIEYRRILIERDGYSKENFINTKLIAAMNPDEGFLSSTVLEKIGIYVETDIIEDINLRKEIVKLNILDKKEDMIDFELLKELQDAKDRKNHVKIDENAISFACEICSKAYCEGYRGLFNLIEAAKAICALDGIRKVGAKELTEAMEYTLKHRKNEPQEEPQDSNSQNQDEDSQNEDENNEKQKNDQNDENQDENDGENDGEFEFQLDQDDVETDRKSQSQSENPELILPNEIFEIKNIFDFKGDRIKRKGSGKRTKTETSENRGKVVGARNSNKEIKDIHYLRTIMAGLMDGAYDFEDRKLKLRKEHLRKKTRKNRIGASVVFVVDASKSMNAKKRMVETKNAILSILMDSYIKRDEVAMISFSGESSDLLLPFTNSPILAKRELESLETKGKTPMSDGLYRALELIRIRKRKNADIIPILVLITDGHANRGNIFKENPLEDAEFVASLIREENINSVVIDTETGFVKLGLPKKISQSLGARYYKLEDIKSEKIANIVRNTKDFSISRVDIMED